MSGRYGRYRIALGGLIASLLLGGATVPEKALHRVDTAGHEQGSQGQAAGSQPQQTVAPATPPAPKKQEIAQHQEAKTGPAKEADGKPSFARDPLAWLMAWVFDPDNFSNFLIMLFTLALTVVAVMQHRLEERLASDTSDSIAIAKQSADAATASVEVSKETMRRQLRAYVSVELGALEKVVADERPVGSVLVTNSGRTPAYNVTTKIVVLKASPGETVAVPDYQKGMERTHLIIGANHDKRTRKSADFALIQQDIDRAKEYKSAIVVAGITVYDDIFGNTWWTQFCHLYNGPEMSGQYHTDLNHGI